jgi:hypothetical protein
MLRWLLSGMMCVASVALLGCKNDDRQQVVQGVIKSLGDSKRHLQGIREKIDEAVSKGSVDMTEGVFKLDAESVEAAKKLMKEMKDDKSGPVKKMLDWENEAKRGKPPTAEEKRELAAANKSALDREITGLIEEYSALLKSLEEASKKDKEGAQALNEELSSSLGDLAKIAQRN